MASARGTSNQYDHQTTGNALTFEVAVHKSIQDLLENGGRVRLWNGSLLFTFGAQQNSVRLTFRPIDGSYALEGTCTDADGNALTTTFSGNAVEVTLNRTAGEFTLEMRHVDARDGGSGGSPSHPSGNAKLVLTTEVTTPDPDLHPGFTAPSA